MTRSELVQKLDKEVQELVKIFLEEIRWGPFLVIAKRLLRRRG